AMTGGAVIALSAAAAGPNGGGHQLRRAYERTATALTRPPVKATACILLMAIAAFALAGPAAAGAIPAPPVGLAARFFGASGPLDLVGSSQWAWVESTSLRRAGRRYASVGTAVVAGVGSILVFGGSSFARAVEQPHAPHPSISATGCNGHIVLCDRR